MNPPPSNSSKEIRSIPVILITCLGLLLIFPTKIHPDPSILSVFQDFMSPPPAPHPNVTKSDGYLNKSSLQRAERVLEEGVIPLTYAITSVCFKCLFYSLLLVGKKLFFSVYRQKLDGIYLKVSIFKFQIAS